MSCLCDRGDSFSDVFIAISIVNIKVFTLDRLPVQPRINGKNIATKNNETASDDGDQLFYYDQVKVILLIIFSSHKR